MKERRSIRLKVRRTKLADLLDLADGVQIVQVTVGNDGELDFLLEGDGLPLISKRGKAPDYHVEDIPEDGVITISGTGSHRIRKP